MIRSKGSLELVQAIIWGRWEQDTQAKLEDNKRLRKTPRGRRYVPDSRFGTPLSFSRLGLILPLVAIAADVFARAGVTTRRAHQEVTQVMDTLNNTNSQTYICNDCTAPMERTDVDGDDRAIHVNYECPDCGAGGTLEHFWNSSVTKYWGAVTTPRRRDLEQASSWERANGGRY